MRVPTLYIRNVPPRLYEALRKQAALSGRSLNAEAIEILERGVGGPMRAEELIEELKRVSIHLRPGDPPPEEIIREVRDAGWDAG